MDHACATNIISGLFSPDDPEHLSIRAKFMAL